MADLANLVLAIDSTSVTKATADLNTLTAAGGRAEAASTSLGLGFKGASAQATEMATAAQLSARAAMDQASGFGAATNAARVNTMAMRESLVVARELSRGNFTRIPGSLSLLAQGISSGGGLGAYAQALGLIKQVQNAELAEAAAATAASAAGVEAAARKAASNILVVDTELALAQAQLRVAETSGAVAAAEARIAAANQAVAVAASEATIAENALAVANGRAGEASVASAAATLTSLNPVTIALGVAAIAVGVLVYKWYEHSDAVEKATEKLQKHWAQTQANEEAQRAFAGTLDGVAESLDKINKALDKESEKWKLSNQLLVDQAQNALNVAKSRLAIADAIVAQNSAERKWQMTQPNEGGDIGAMRASQSIAAAQADADLARKAIANADGTLLRAKSLLILQQETQSKAEKINRHYAEAEEMVRRNALVHGQVNTLLKTQIDLLEKKKQLELDSLKTSTRSLGLHGHQIDFAAAEEIARAAGLKVTSAYRSSADQARLFNDPRYNHPGNPVARPGTSAHEGINGKWALDIAFAPGISAQSLKKLYGADGVDLTAIYKESGHFHIEGSRGNAARAERADQTAAAKAAREVQKAKDELKNYDDSIFTLNKQILEAKKLNATSEEEQSAFAIQALEQERGKALADAKALLSDKKINSAQEAIKELKINQLYDEKELTDTTALYLKKLKDSQAATDQLFGFQTDALKFADQMATTQGEHRKLQLEMLDIQYQQKKADLEILLLTQQKSKDVSASLLTQGKLAHLPLEKAMEQQLTRAKTMDPLEAWKQSVAKSAPEITQALQGIEVRGLDGLASALTGVVTGTESLGKAFKNISRSIIADIVQMTIKMLIFRAISSIFGGGLSGVNGANATNGLALANAGQIPGFATGGSMIIGGNGGVDQNLLALNGQPIARVGQGETLAVHPAGQAANDTQRGPIEIRLTVDTSENLDAKVDAKVIAAAGQAVKISVDHMNSTIKALRRPGISGGR